MWKKESNEPNPIPAPRPSTPIAPERAPGRAAGHSAASACIGSSLRIKGEIHGAEDLLIEGHCEGLIQLDSHTVTVGPAGRVEGDIVAKVIAIEGEVIGNLVGEQEVVVRQNGRVEGNLKAPRINLQDGCHFQGSIDMGGAPGKSQSKGDTKSDSKNDKSQLARPKDGDSQTPRPGSADVRTPGAGTAATPKAPSLH